MIVCLCKGICENELQSVCDDDVGTVREVGRRCGAGTDCGMCRADIHSMLRRHESEGERQEAPMVLSK